MLAFVVAEGSGSLQILFNVPSTTFFLVATFMTLEFSGLIPLGKLGMMSHIWLDVADALLILASFFDRVINCRPYGPETLSFSSLFPLSSLVLATTVITLAAAAAKLTFVQYLLHTRYSKHLLQNDSFLLLNNSQVLLVPFSR